MHSLPAQLLTIHTKAMQLCVCTRQEKRPRCSCKNFEKVASEGGSIFYEAMYTCACTVRKTFSKCDNKLHVQALDYRAATFEEMKELERAQKDAEWILELAPRLPDVWTSPPNTFQQYTYLFRGIYD